MWFDLPVVLGFGVIYAFGAVMAAARIRRRFLEASWLTASAVTGTAALAFSLMGLQLGAIWSGVWETVRIGDGHFGTFRAARPFWGNHLGLLFPRASCSSAFLPRS